MKEHCDVCGRRVCFDKGEQFTAALSGEACCSPGCRTKAEDRTKTQEEIDKARRQMAEEIVQAQNLTSLEDAKEFATRWIVTAAQNQVNADYYREERDRLLEHEKRLDSV